MKTVTRKKVVTKQVVNEGNPGLLALVQNGCVIHFPDGTSMYSHEKRIAICAAGEVKGGFEMSRDGLIAANDSLNALRDKHDIYVSEGSSSEDEPVQQDVGQQDVGVTGANTAEAQVDAADAVAEG